MPTFVSKLFDTSDFPARWHCGNWTVLHGWTHILSDSAIFAAYMAIPVALAYFIRRRRDLPRPIPATFWLFGAFIVACGLTHLCEAIIFWKPIYRLAGFAKATTATVSWFTFALLIPVIPKALSLQGPEALRRRVLEATEELRRERDAAAHLAAIVRSSRDIIIGTDLGRLIESFNPGAERTLGYAAEEVIGCHISVLMPDGFSFELKDGYPDVLADVSTVEVELIGKSGNRIPVSLTISPVASNDGQLVGASLIARDMTDLKRAQDELKLSVERLKQSNDDLEQFAYVASHDLQEPLRMVSAYTQLIEKEYKGKLDERADRFIAYSVDGARRMKKLVDDLLTYSRIGTRGRLFELCSTEVVLQTTLDRLRLVVEESGGSVTSGRMPSVYADASQLEHVFQNLISNAIKFRREVPPIVHVSANRTGAFWEFRVEDNGIGLDEEQAPLIFQMFQRLHERRKYVGSGIGLAIAKRIIERHGGTIWVRSTPGEGSCFTFTLPVMADSDVQAPTPARQSSMMNQKEKPS